MRRVGDGRGALATAATCVGAVVLSLAGCSNSSDSSAGGAAKDPECASKAEAFLKPYEDLPTTLPPEYTPLSTAPTPGKSVVYLASSSPFEQAMGKNMQAAAEAVGWTSKTVNHNNTVEDFNAKFMQAVNESPRPDVIAFEGWPIAEIQQSVAAAKAEGILVDDGSILDAPSDSDGVAGFSATSNGESTFAQKGKVLANWVMSDSGCTAHVAWFTLPYPIIEVLGDSLESTLKAECSACEFKYNELKATDYGTPAAIAAIMSAIQEDPELKYVGVYSGGLTQGLQSALSAAGITGIKIFGDGPLEANYEALKSGDEQMFLNSTPTLNSWISLDAAFRVFDSGEPFKGLITPVAMLTNENIPSDSGPTTAYPSDYESLFKELWKVG